MSGCIDFVGPDADWGSYDFADRRTPVARKFHCCCECKRAISPGRQYVYEVCCWDGDFDVFKTCADCFDFREKIACSFQYGFLWEGWRNYLDYCEDESCIPWDKIADLRPWARFMALDVIEADWVWKA